MLNDRRGQRAGRRATDLLAAGRDSLRTTNHSDTSSPPSQQLSQLESQPATTPGLSAASMRHIGTKHCCERQLVTFGDYTISRDWLRDEIAEAARRLATECEAEDLYHIITRPAPVNGEHWTEAEYDAHHAAVEAATTAEERVEALLPIMAEAVWGATLDRCTAILQRAEHDLITELDKPKTRALTLDEWMQAVIELFKQDGLLPKLPVREAVAA